MAMQAPFFAPQSFEDADAALNYVCHIYEAGIDHLRGQLQRFIALREQPQAPLERVRACYPLVRMTATGSHTKDTALSFGFVAQPGRYESTLTRPDLFGNYYRKQFELLMRNHGTTLDIATSHQPIPLPFSLAEHDHFEAGFLPWHRQMLSSVFDLPDLRSMDDHIANGTFEQRTHEPAPLALFTAPRVDYSLHRLRHYTGTSPAHFQNFVLFTNYQFYIDEFVAFGLQQMHSPSSPYIAFVQPGNVVTRRIDLNTQPHDTSVESPHRLPQMPAYHLVREDCSGISFVNIGVGPSNAKTITDHIAVLRPHAWIMVGHCAGLRDSQQLGDYVLAHGYVREDHVLDEDLPLWIPLPALAEVQIALQEAVADVTQLHGAELKRVLRTGTVATTANRNWELLGAGALQRRLSQSRAVALDMESAIIAGNGFRFRVPYGTLLCVSDKPLHGEIKLPGMADQFYRQRVKQHLQIGISAIERLRQNGIAQLHSRKLRSFAEVAFQ